MTATEAHAYFDLLTDKQSQYFTDAEKDNFLTQASIEFVKRHIPSSENFGVNLEVDQINFNNLYTLIYSTGGLTMSTAGVITTSAVQSALDTASSSTEPFMGILDVNWTKSSVTYPVKYTRHNNWFSYLQNTFKTGSSTSPRYKYDKTNFTFYPIDTTASVKFNLLKQPKAVSLSGSVTIELPSHVHKAVVEIAVDIATSSMRDGELKQLNAS